MPDSCQTCRFAIEKGCTLHCRKNPPVVTDSDSTFAKEIYGTGILWGWPRVERDDWCGNHEPADREKP